MRELRAVGAADASAVLDALRDALADGPAVFPRHAGTEPLGVPTTVPDRIALVVETSGSSGRPKRVALSADAIRASAAASASALGGGGQWLLALPAHYIAGINVLTRSLLAGVDPVFMPSERFDPREFVRAAESMHPGRRFTSLVPVQLNRVVELAEQDAAARAIIVGFDRILVGGQAAPAALLDRAAKLGIRVTRTYGSSETCGGCVYDGVPLPGVGARIVDGEVQLAGPMLAEEYIADAERTASAFVTEAGTRWYRTGDSGTLENGVLSVSGRRDRVIISGGLKLSLDAVERAVRAVPGHDAAVAVPVPDPRWGEGFVIVTTGTVELPASALLELGRAARPREVIVVAAIPLLPSGKPDRIALAGLVSAR